MNSDTSPTGRSADLKLIGETVAGVERTQRARDADGFMRLLDENIVWVTAFGKRISGWRDVNAFTQKVLTPALGDHYTRYDVAQVTFLDKDVAAVHVHQVPTDETGRPDMSEPEGRPLYVMTRTNGVWKIAIAQNTRVQADALAEQAKAIGKTE